VILAEAARSVLGESVAVPLAVGGAHEGGYDVEVPFLDVGGLAPEIGETEVDVELEEVDPGRSLGHARKGRTRIGRRIEAPLYDRPMVPEAPLEETEHGLAAAGEGWFVLNACEARWRHRAGRGEGLYFEGKTDFPQVGINLFVLAPAEPIGMYHWEADQEDFLVLSGEALLIIEGQERPLRQWDFVHCPPHTQHMIVGAGDRHCVVLAVGAREHQQPGEWGAYTVDETALRHGAGVERETADGAEAYARFPESADARYRDGWLTVE
jgi:uncharacterized cupin superfamily protein